MTAPALRRRPRPFEIVKALVDLLWTTGLLVAIPIGLAVIFGWPLPRQVPDWSEVTSTPLQLLDRTVIINVLVCLAWLLWAIVVIYVAIDLLDSARGVGRRVRGSWPGAVVAGRFVAAVVILFALLRPQSGTEHLNRPPAAVTALAAPDTSVTLVSSTHAQQADRAAPSMNGPRTYMVKANDTQWDIAETHLGSGRAWRNITAANPDLPTVDGERLRLKPGMTINLPTDQVAAVPDRVETVHVVEAGDTLSQIAHDDLGDGNRYPEIAAANPDLIGDPNRIEPGWTLTIPHTTATPPPSDTAAPESPGDTEGPAATDSAPPEQPSTPASPTPAVPSAETPAPILEAPVAVPTTTPAPVLETPAVVPTTAPAPVPVPPTPSWSPSTTSETVPLWLQARGFHSLDEFRAWAAQHPDEAAPVTAPTPTPALVPGESSTGWALKAAVPSMVAAAIALTLRRRRRRVLSRRPAGAPLPSRDETLLPTERSLMQLVDDEGTSKVHWVDTVLRVLTTLGPGPSLCLVRPTVSDLELLWSAPPAHRAPAGFVVEPGGHGWRVGFDESIAHLEDLAKGHEPIAPCLVTVGETGSGPALANLAALAPLHVTGAAEAVSSWLTGVKLELAAQPWCQDVRLDHATSETDVTIEVVVDVDTRSLTVAVRETPPGATAAWSLELDEEEARLRSADEAFDLRLTPVGIDRDDTHRLLQLLDEAAVDPYRQPLTLLDQPSAPVPVAPAPSPEVRSAQDLAAQAGIDLPVPPRFEAAAAEPADPVVEPRVTEPAPDDVVQLELDNIEPPAVPAGEPKPTEQRPLAAQVSSERDMATGRSQAGEATALSEAAAWGPRIALRLLGQPSIDGAVRNVQPKRIGLIAYLALERPYRPHRNEIVNVVWGGAENGRKNLNTACSELRKDFEDEDFIVVDGAGRYHLCDAVDTDWEQFKRLEARAKGATGRERLGLLRDALALVRGAPFAYSETSAFGWVAPERQAEMEVGIHNLAELFASEALAAGQGPLAVWGARQGLRGCPDVTGLYEYILAGHAMQGDLPAVEATWREVQAEDDVPREVIAIYEEERRRLLHG